MKINGLKILVTFLPLCSSQTSINSYLQLALLYLTLHILPFALVFKHAQISPNLRNIFPEPPPPSIFTGKLGGRVVYMIATLVWILTPLPQQNRSL